MKITRDSCKVDKRELAKAEAEADGEAVPAAEAPAAE